MLPLCALDLVIVLDDTSQAALNESRDIARDVIDTQLTPYIQRGDVTLTVVTSTKTLNVSRGSELGKKSLYYWRWFGVGA